MNKHQERKETPVFTGCMMYFPKALQCVSQISLAGSKQHHKGQPMHWDRSKSTDEPDALVRHLIDAGLDGKNLDDDGTLHAGKVAWRALAYLEKILEEK